MSQTDAPADATAPTTPAALGARAAAALRTRAGAGRAAATGRIDEVDTPAVAIDLDVVEHNVAKLQAYCDAHGIANRPHIKTHKLPLVAHLQMAAGAAGLTVQTLGEAEVLVAAGLRDLFVTYDVIGEAKALRLARLARLAAVRVGVDNAVALATVARAAALAGREIGVLVEFESGKLRQGVTTPEQALDLARRVVADPNLRFLGLMTYPAGPAVVPFVTTARAMFAAEGIAIEVVSVGGTPGMWRTHELPGVTELRVGTSVYHDRKSVAGGAGRPDECALYVHVTVVSRAAPDRCVIDAGSKVLTSDLVPPAVGQGYGRIVEYPDAVIRELSEEHGAVDLSACALRPEIGERLRVLPNHVCPVSNLVDEVVLHRDGHIEAVVPVAARGKR